MVSLKGQFNSAKRHQFISIHLIKERLDIEESLEKRVKTILKFLNIKSKIIKGNIISIKNINLAYIEPHKLIIGNITYLFFNECDNVYINNLKNFTIKLFKSMLRFFRNDTKFIYGALPQTPRFNEYGFQKRK